MKLVLDVGQVDYAAIAEKAMPLLRDKAKEMDGPMKILATLPAPLVRKTIETLPESAKDQMVAYLVNHNKDKIISAAQNFAEKQGFSITINSVSVEE